MAIDTRNRRGSALGVNPFSPVLPNPDGDIDTPDRAQLAHVYSGLFGSATVVTGENMIFPDTHVEVVKLTAQAKDGSGPQSWYLGVDHFYEGNLYEDSPMIWPMLVEGPSITREVGRTFFVEQGSQIRIWGKSDFLRKGYTFADLLNDYEFNNADVEVRYYCKPIGASTEHDDDVNIRWTGKVVGFDYGDNGGVVTLQARQVLFKDREFGRRYSESDFHASASSEYLRWGGEQMPTPFGNDPTGLQGVIVSNAAIRRYLTTTGGSFGFTFQAAEMVIGVVPSDTGMGVTFQSLFVQNPFPAIDPRPWLQAESAVDLDTPVSGPTILNSGTTTFSGKTWRFAHLITVGDESPVLSGFTVKSKRVGDIDEGDGKFSVSVFRAQQDDAGKWGPIDNRLCEAIADATAMSTSLANVILPLKELCPLPPNQTYMAIAEWTRHSTDQKRIDYVRGSSPIEVTTSGDHGWVTGDSVTISGVIGCTNANGTFTITKTADNKFTLDGTTGNGTSALSITGATRRRPIVITTGSAHGLTTGQEVQVSGVEGNTAANGTWIVEVVTSTTFKLLGSVGNGTYAASGTKTITGATNATPIVVTTSTSHGLEDNDIVQIASVAGNTAANGVWRITKLSATTFSLDDSVGNGAYTSGGTVTWGGVVQVNCTAERNKYVTLAIDATDTSDPCYVNDPSKNADGWGVNPGRFQMQVHGTFFTSGLNADVGNYRMRTLNIISTLPNSPQQIAGPAFKPGVEGIFDGASTGYQGAGGTEIENPASIIKFILLDGSFGAAVPDASVDITTIDAIRDVIGSTQDMAFSVEEKVSCMDLIVRICEQARLIVYPNRRGVITMHRPTYPESWAEFRFGEGRMRGELQLLKVEDLPQSEVVNAIDAVFYPDALQQVTDPHVLKNRKDRRFTGLVYVSPDGVSTGDLDRPAKAIASEAIYGQIRLLEQYDLYYAEAPVEHTMLYKFHRYSKLQKRVTVRIPRKQFFESDLDLFSACTVSHSGIRSRTGAVCIEAGKAHYDSTPVPGYYEGVPVIVVGTGTIRGEVVRIVEQGPDILVTAETVSPYPSAVVS